MEVGALRQGVARACFENDPFDLPSHHAYWRYYTWYGRPTWRAATCRWLAVAQCVCLRSKPPPVSSYEIVASLSTSFEPCPAQRRRDYSDAARERACHATYTYRCLVSRRQIPTRPLPVDLWLRRSLRQEHNQNRKRNRNRKQNRKTAKIAGDGDG